MLVSIISPNLSGNCLGRAYVLAQLVERNHDVEIVGPQFESEIWSPIRDKYDYKAVKTKAWIHRFPFSIPDILHNISGDVIYASKPQTTSYGVALLATLGRERPLILDIDDWESGFSYRYGKIGSYLRGIPGLIHLNSHYYTLGLEKLSSLADARTASNQFIRNRFGGTIVPHAKDTEKLNPSRFDKHEIREEFNLPADDFLVMFSGTPRSHKGVDDLARAIAGIERDNIRTVVVGAHDSEYVDKIRQIGGDSIIIRGIQPFDEIPKWLAAADVVGIPQKNTVATRGQLPSKVFDAMAMGKPVVATKVNDLPEVLDGCGLLVEPGNVAQLRASILKLQDKPALRRRLGRSARNRCVDKYSYDVVAPRVDNIITEVCQ